MTFSNSEKLLNFKAHELQWTVYELCTCILRVRSSCPAMAHLYKWTLWKNHPSIVFSSKKQKTKKQNKNKKKTKKRHKQQDNRNQKYQVIISNYNFRYPVIYKFTVFTKPKILPKFFKKYERKYVFH